MSEEIWLPVTITEYTLIYEVSSMGRIRSLPHKNKIGRRIAGTIFRPGTSGSGYSIVTLSLDGKQTTHCVHHLVAYAFLGDRHDGLAIHHKNGCKSDNRAVNLEYVTSSKNMKHAYDTHLLIPARGETHYNASLTEADVREIRRLYPQGGYSQKQLGYIFEIGPDMISRIVNRKRWGWLD